MHSFILPKLQILATSSKFNTTSGASITPTNGPILRHPLKQMPNHRRFTVPRHKERLENRDWLRVAYCHRTSIRCSTAWRLLVLGRRQNSASSAVGMSASSYDESQQRSQTLAHQKIFINPKSRIGRGYQKGIS